MSGNAHIRCEAGENLAIISKDYLSLLPKIDSAEMMFSASRSRRISIVPIIQSFAQLDKNYGKEGAEIIIDNTQLTVFGGFAPNSQSADKLSSALGKQTVVSGSIMQSANNPSRTLMMMERALMTPEELKTMPKGTFVVAKTGYNPIKVKLKLFFEWGITFEDIPFTMSVNNTGNVCYADREKLFAAVKTKFGFTDEDDEMPNNCIQIEDNGNLSYTQTKFHNGSKAFRKNKSVKAEEVKIAERNHMPQNVKLMEMQNQDAAKTDIAQEEDSE